MGPSVESKEDLALSPMRTKQQEKFSRNLSNTLNSHNINVDDNHVFKNLKVGDNEVSKKYSIPL
jgi:hypothetical protein